MSATPELDPLAFLRRAFAEATGGLTNFADVSACGHGARFAIEDCNECLESRVKSAVHAVGGAR